MSDALKPYTVKVWRKYRFGRDKDTRGRAVGVRHNVMAASRRDAYWAVANEFPPHDTFDAWANEERRAPKGGRP